MKIMKITPKLSSAVLYAFPSLKNAVFFEKIIPKIPAAPSTFFSIYKDEHDQLLTLVQTDYANPEHQSDILYESSGKYAFDVLLKAFDNKASIEIDNADTEDSFYITDSDTTYYPVYFYVAKIKMNEL